MSPPRVIVVCGPTGVGKTALAMDLAERLEGEIVGADSMQVYRHMDVGTGKATPAEQARVPHHVVDVVDPDEDFHVGRYREEAVRAIDDIESRHRRAIVVGGTGLYIKILLRGIFKSPAADEGLRARYEQEGQTYGVQALHDRLKLVDPELAAKINDRDRVRIIRALEIYDQTGIPLSEHQQAHSFSEARYDALVFGLRRERAELYERIDMRVDRMMEAGFAAEVQGLLDRGYGPDLRPMGALGYKQICQALAGELTMEEAHRRIQRDTRRYAKRQHTWFNKDEGVHWVDAPWPTDALAGMAREFLRA